MGARQVQRAAVRAPLERRRRAHGSRLAICRGRASSSSNEEGDAVTARGSVGALGGFELVPPAVHLTNRCRYSALATFICSRCKKRICRCFDASTEHEPLCVVSPGRTRR
jgi:hypothetical protein